MKRKSPKKFRGTRKRKIRRTRQTRPQVPKTVRQYFSKSEQFQETWDAVGHVISKMRANRKFSLRTASKRNLMLILKS